MAHAQNLEGKWEVAAAVLAEQAMHELRGMQEAARQSQAVLEDLMAINARLLTSCTAKLKTINQDIRDMVAHEIATQGLASKRPPAKRPAAKRAAKTRRMTT